jgi:WD40 repeat protein
MRRVDLPVGADWVNCAVWSPDGDVLALAAGRQILLTNRDGAGLARLDHPATVTAIVCSSRRELASACYGQAAVWDVDAASPRDIYRFKNSFIALAVSPDAGILACGGQDASVHFWRRGSGQDSEMRGYESKVAALAFDPSGRWLATGGAAHASIWDFSGSGPEGTAPIQLEADGQAVTALAWGRRQAVLATGGLTGCLCIWRLGINGSGSLIGAAKLAGAVTGIAWRADQRAVAVLDAGGGLTVFRARL